MLELNMHGFKCNFNNFNKEFIIKFLQKRPLYFSHIFIHTIKNSFDIPLYLKDFIKDLSHINTDVFTRIYSKSFIYFPDDIKEKLISELKKYADIMSDEDEKVIENWDMTNKI